jgi:hypothetical protein
MKVYQKNYKNHVEKLGKILAESLKILLEIGKPRRFFNEIFTLNFVGFQGKTCTKFSLETREVFRNSNEP